MGKSYKKNVQEFHDKERHDKKKDHRTDRNKEKHHIQEFLEKDEEDEN